MNEGDNVLNLQSDSAVQDNGQPIKTNLKQEKKHKSKALTIGLIFSILNLVFCLLSISIFTYLVFESIFTAETGAASGWFLLVGPVIILMYACSFFPDVLYIIFATLSFVKPKSIFIILTIISLVFGFILSNGEMTAGYLTYLPIINKVIKVLLIIYNVALLILINVKKKSKA